MIVLDTHTLLWWVSGNRNQLSVKAARAIDREMKDGRIMVSSISSWELAMLLERGRLSLSTDLGQWLSTVSQIEPIQFVPVDNKIAVASVNLPGNFQKDPADRIIVATARILAAPLVTADEKIQAYPHVRTIW